MGAARGRGASPPPPYARRVRGRDGRGACKSGGGGAGEMAMCAGNLGASWPWCDAGAVCAGSGTLDQAAGHLARVRPVQVAVDVARRRRGPDAEVEGVVHGGPRHVDDPRGEGVGAVRQPNLPARRPSPGLAGGNRGAHVKYCAGGQMWRTGGCRSGSVHLMRPRWQAAITVQMRHLNRTAVQMWRTAHRVPPRQRTMPYTCAAAEPRSER